MSAVIASPEKLTYRSGALWVGEQRIDLVYNRLTDFYLQAPSLKTLARAYRDNAIVLTPHPHSHALYGNKHNLVILSDAQALRSMNAPSDISTVLLGGIPRTLAVSANDSERWWSDGGAIVNSGSSNQQAGSVVVAPIAATN